MTTVMIPYYIILLSVAANKKPEAEYFIKRSLFSSQFPRFKILAQASSWLWLSLVAQDITMVELCAKMASSVCRVQGAEVGSRITTHAHKNKVGSCKN
jgi:hypothetical protein